MVFSEHDGHDLGRVHLVGLGRGHVLLRVNAQHVDLVHQRVVHTVEDVRAGPVRCAVTTMCDYGLWAQGGGGALDSAISAAVDTCTTVPPRNALASAVGVSFSDVRAVRGSRPP